MFKNAADKIYLTTYGQGNAQAQLFVRAEALWVETAAGERPLTPSELNDADTVLRMLRTAEARTALTSDAYGVLAERSDGSYSVSIQMRGLGGGGVCSAEAALTDEEGHKKAREREIITMLRLLRARNGGRRAAAVQRLKNLYLTDNEVHLYISEISLAIPRLVELFQDTHEPVRMEAAGFLIILAGGSAEINHLLAQVPGVLLSLVKILFDTHCIIRGGQAIGALKILYFCSIENKCLIVAKVPRVLEHLVKLLHHTDCTIKTTAVIVLWSLSRHKPGGNTYLIAQVPGVLSHLVVLLDDADYTTKISAMGLLETLVLDSTETRHKIAKTPEVLSRLVKLLYDRLFDVRKQAVITLGAIVYDSAENQRLMLTQVSGAVLRLVELICDTNSEIRESAQRVLNTVVRSSAVNQLIIAQTPGVLLLLVNLLGAPWTLWQVANILKGITEHSIENINLISEIREVLSRLIELLRGNDLDARVAAVNVLRALANGSTENKRLIAQTPGALWSLARLLNRDVWPWGDQEIMAVMRALLILADGSNENKSLITQTSRVVSGLIRLLSNPNSDVQKLARLVLQSLATIPANKIRINTATQGTPFSNLTSTFPVVTQTTASVVLPLVVAEDDGVAEYKSTEETPVAVEAVVYDEVIVEEITIDTWRKLGLELMESPTESTKAITVWTTVIEGTPASTQSGTPAAIELADAYLFRSRAFSWLACQDESKADNEEQWRHALADGQRAAALYGEAWSERKVEAVLTIGKAHYHLHQYAECSEALKSLTHSSTLDSGRYPQLVAEAHGWSAQVDYQRQDYASVLYHYAARGWIQADSAVAGADECAAAVYEQQQQPAHETLSTLPLSAELCTLYFQRAQACYQAQPSRYQAALGYLSLALVGLPTAEVYHLRCTIYLLQQRYDLAQQDAERALTADSNHALTYHHLGWMLQQQGGDRNQITCYYTQFLERAGDGLAAARASALYGQWWCAPATILIEAEEGVGDKEIVEYQAERHNVLTTAQSLMHTAQLREPFWVAQQQTIEAALKINDDRVALALECHRRGEYLAAYRLLAVCIDKSPGRKDLQLHQIEALYALANSKKDSPEEQQDDLKLAKHDIDAFLQRCKREGAPPAQKAQAQRLLERIEQSLDQVMVVGTENPYLYPESDDRIGESITEIISEDIDTHSMDGEFKATVEERFAVTVKLSAEMLAAIESGRVQDLQGALTNDRQQLNASNDNRNTPLHLLVTKSSIEGVRYLLEQGADATLANHQFQRAIDLAKNHTIKQLLLQHRKRHDAKVVKAYLETCLKHYDNASVDERPQVRRRQVARYVSRLTGVNVLELLKKPGMRKRHLAHLEEIIGDNPEVSPQNRRSVEGWWAQEFLPLRIYATFEVLVDMMIARDLIERSVYSVEDWPPDTMPTITGQVPKPADRITLNIAASKVISKYQQYLLTELETLYSHQEQEVVGIPQRALNSNEQALLKALTDGILNRLSCLTEGDSACYYVGYKGHAIHLNIIKQADGYAITIHNLGEGYPSYHTVDAASGEVYAFPLGILSTAELQRAMAEPGHSFRQYLIKILTARCEQRAAADALPILYVRDPSMLKLSALPIDPQTKRPPQEGGHCVARSHESVRWQVLGTQAKWFTTQEKRLVVDEDRAVPQNLAKAAGDCSTVDSHFHRKTSSKSFQSEAEKLAEMQQRVAKRAVTQLCNLLSPWLQHNHLSAAQCEFVNERYLARMPIPQDSASSVLETMKQFVNELNGADAIMVASMPTSAAGEGACFIDFRCDPEHLDELARRMARFQIATAMPSIAESTPTPPPEIAKWVEGFGQPAAVAPPVTVSPCLDELSRSREQAAAVEPRKVEAVRPMRTSPYLADRSRNPQANSVRFANPIPGV